MKTNFDFVAPYYDRLLKMVFGRSMFRGQTIFLSQISPDANVLVLGGGTGWLLAELLISNHSCKIWYIEASIKMLELTKARIGKSSQVTFIHGTQDTLPPDVRYDVVVTNFFLDLFSRSELERVIPKIAASLRSKSAWHVCDFNNTTWWHSAFLKVMYAFFYLTAGLSADRLPNWRVTMKESGFSEIKTRTFFNGFIVNSVLTRLS